jgi:hypothetical protein
MPSHHELIPNFIQNFMVLIHTMKSPFSSSGLKVYPKTMISYITRDIGRQLQKKYWWLWYVHYISCIEFAIVAPRVGKLWARLFAIKTVVVKMMPT